MGNEFEPAFAGLIRETVAESTPWHAPEAHPGTEAPNIVVVVLDDVGFAQFGCFGSTIETPTIDRLAFAGTRYTNLHVTPLCSPTRACLLSGRNHHSVGMGMLAGFPSGFPNGRECVSDRAPMLPSLLQQAGYRTYAIGKWHLTPMKALKPSGPFDHWPLRKGFDRFYGFLGGETDQYRPNLVRDNHFIDPPREDYHLSEDLADAALQMVADHRSGDPDRPFFAYLAFGAGHGPHQVPEPYRSKYRGRFDDGWDVERERVFARQLATGVIPAGTRLPEPNPDVQRWEDLTAEQKQLMARYAEVYAGYIEHADAQIGRFLDGLAALGADENTLVMVVSDNGASGEAGESGTWNELIALNDFPPVDDTSAARIDELGSPTTYPLYPTGWAQAGNTPCKLYKHYTFGGGVRAPLVVHWPGHTGEVGRVHDAFLHAIDVTPTLLEVAGVSVPADDDQIPIHGVPFSLAAEDRASASERTQYFEMGGHRGLYKNGWKAVTLHEVGVDYADDQWELYHLDADFSEVNDLAAQEPERLKDMVDTWWREAHRFGVLPLDDRFVERSARPDPQPTLVYYQGAERIAESAVPALLRTTWTMSTKLTDYVDQEGVIFSFGGTFGGFVLHMINGSARLDFNYFGEVYDTLELGPLPTGTLDLNVTYRPADTGGAGVELSTPDLAPVRATIARVVPYYTGGNGLSVGRDPLAPVVSVPTAGRAYSGHFGQVRFDLDLGAALTEDGGLMASWLAAD
ncbi:arylsulfatase [Streptomyces sp. NPDC050164]|uniref:arylsulfatase n=1 Tax=Streptomyces sp. NPDC050164 TaxID=3365605 RepID=UPI0037979129